MSLWGRRPDRVTLLATGALLALLVILALLQFHWIGEVSRAERDRLRSRLLADSHRFSEELDREVTRAFMAFVQHTTDGDPRPRLAEQMRRWQAAAPHPGLVRGLYLARVDSTDPAAPADHLVVERLEATGRFTPAGWPIEVAALGRQLAERVSDPGKALPIIDGGAPALVLPLAPPFHPLATSDGAEAASPPGFVLVQLDRDVLARTLLSDLAERFFAVSRDRAVLVAVNGPAGLIYRSDPTVPAARYLPGDIALPLLGLRRLERLHGLTPGPLPLHGPGLDHHSGHSPDHLRIFLPFRTRLHGRSTPLTAGAWQLIVTHRSGSLEAAVARARWHNLAVSSSILALLAASLGVLAVSARRARALSRRQMELVAGITHELNTPLTAIRSAAQNLADGVVADPAQVRRYGSLLDREGARLAGLVAQALELAGIQSGTRVYRPEPVAVAQVVDEVLADLRWPLAEHGLTGERLALDLPADLPPVLADRNALRRALANLVDNAVKYAADGGWLGIRGRAPRDGQDGRVEITVADRGPGIAAADRPHLFEPFYRGRAVAPGRVPGSGLGLSLVRQIAEAHGGSVALDGPEPGADGRGASFTLRLPAAPPSAASGTPA